MDILMEELDGLETMKIIRKKENNSHIPIIALSANVFEEDKKEAINAGANDFLPKPVAEKDILLILKKYLNIEFEYEEKEEKIDLSKELKTLQKEFFEKLNEKALLMDNEAIFELLKNYQVSSDLENYIKSLINEFKYEKLLNLV